jgi:hypothetical protein
MFAWSRAGWAAHPDESSRKGDASDGLIDPPRQGRRVEVGSAMDDAGMRSAGRVQPEEIAVMGEDGPASRSGVSENVRVRLARQSFSLCRDDVVSQRGEGDDDWAGEILVGKQPGHESRS